MRFWKAQKFFSDRAQELRSQGPLQTAKQAARRLAVPALVLAVIAVPALTIKRELDADPAATTATADAEFVSSLPDSEALIWAVGDGADGSSGAKDLGAMIAAGEPDRFLYLGDVYPEGTAEQFATNYEGVYGDLASITAPTTGNHEWANRKLGYLPYWEAKKGMRPPLWYSFSAGGWQILSLSSEAPHTLGSPQLLWLEEQLETEPQFGDCRLAFWHQPLYSVGPFATPTVETLWNALRGKARLVINGHEHNSQRFAPIDGITEIIAGAGAAASPLEGSEELEELDPAFRELAARNAKQAGGKLAFSNQAVLAALKLELSPGEARFTTVATDGKELDSGQVPCEPGPE